MSRLQLIILWVITLVAGAIVLNLNSQDENDTEAKTNLSPGDPVFEDFKGSNVGGLKLAKGGKSSTMKISDKSWNVVEKDNFPADTQKLANAFDKITKLKVVQGIPAEEKYFDRFGLDANNEDFLDRPREISVLKDDGSILRTIYVGKSGDNTGVSGRGNAGRFVRFSDDSSGVYLVKDDFNFFNEEAATWLYKDFLIMDRPLKISVKATGKDATKPWTVSRKSKSANFELEGLPDNRQSAVASTTAFKRIFANETFTQLLTEEEAKEQRDDTESRVVTIETSEKTIYELTLWPEKSDTPDEEEKKDEPKKDDTRRYIATVKVVQGPQPPVDPGKDASEEEKAAYQAAKINITGAPKRVNRHRALENRFFMLPNKTVKALLVDRVKLHQLKPRKPAPKPAPPKTAPTAPVASPKTSAVSPPIAVPPLPGSQPKKVEAVTPPIAVPPLPGSQPKKVEAVTPPIAVPPLPGSQPKKVEAVTPPIAVPPAPKAKEPTPVAPPKKPEVKTEKPKEPETKKEAPEAEEEPEASFDLLEENP